MKTINTEIIKGKNVLVRIDTDVPLENGEIKDTTRLLAVLPTLELLKENAAKVTILGHLGRPKGSVVTELSLAPVKNKLSELLNLEIELSANNTQSAKQQFTMYENVRFDTREDDGSDEFAKELASNHDLFVFEAFAVSHRDATSTTTLTKILPSYAGLRVAKEVEILTEVMQNPSHPFLAIIGGAKIETKLPTVEKLQSVADFIFVGGRLPHEIKEKNLSFPEHVSVALMNESGLDISEASTQKLTELVKQARYIVWNGPLGKFEDESAQAGTKALCEALKESTAYKVIGGGETINAVTQFEAEDAINFISVGGGAMLEFLSGKQLPGLANLK